MKKKKKDKLNRPMVMLNVFHRKTLWSCWKMDEAIGKTLDKGAIIEKDISIRHFPIFMTIPSSGFKEQMNNHYSEPTVMMKHECGYCSLPNSVTVIRLLETMQCVLFMEMVGNRVWLLSLFPVFFFFFFWDLIWAKSVRPKRKHKRNVKPFNMVFETFLSSKHIVVNHSSDVVGFLKFISQIDRCYAKLHSAQKILLNWS